MTRQDKNRPKEFCQKIENQSVNNSIRYHCQGVKTPTTKFRQTIETTKNQSNIIMYEVEDLKNRRKE